MKQEARMSLDATMIYGANDDFRLNLLARKALFFNDFLCSTENNQTVLAEGGVEYSYNSDGFRSDDFVVNADTLFAGCSFTFGTGMHQKSIWSKLIAEEMGVEHYNLGSPSSSIPAIVYSLFNYFQKYGNPKNLICLFPDFYRMQVPINYNFYYCENNPNVGKDQDMNAYQYIRNVTGIRPSNYQTLDKTLEKPYKIQQGFSGDLPYFLSLRHLMMLEQYCKSSGINFIWGLWQTENYAAILKMREHDSNLFPGLIDLEMYKWRMNYDSLEDEFFPDNRQVAFNNWEESDKLKRRLCHTELENNEPEIFHLGLDRQHGWVNTHWGTHRHRHIADSFIKEIKKNG